MEHLVDQARTLGPRELRILARRALDVIAPEIADDHERRLLEAEEREARKRTSLVSHTSLRRDHLDDPPASADSAAESGSADTEALPYDVKLGQAFCALLEHLDPQRLPLHGGDATTMVVTIDLATLPAVFGADSEILDLGAHATALHRASAPCHEDPGPPVPR